MITKIINLLESDSPANWELGIQLSKGQKLDAEILNIVKGDFLLVCKFCVPYNLWSASLTVDELSLITKKLEANNIYIDLWFDTDMEIGTSDGPYLGYYINYNIGKTVCFNPYKIFEVSLQDGPEYGLKTYTYTYTL